MSAGAIPLPALTRAAATGATLGSASAVSATADREYSLADLLDIALNNSPQLLAAGEEAEQGRLGTQLAKSRYAPEISLNALGGSQRTPLAIPATVSPAGYFVSSTHELLPSLELKWLLFDFGRRDAQLAAAEHTALAAESTRSRVQEKLIFDVSDAYFRALSAQGRVHAAHKALAAAKLAEQAVQAQRDVGRATVVQLAEVRRQSAAMQLALTKALGAARMSFVTLATTVGLPPDTQFALPARAVALDAKPLAPLQTLVDDTLRMRPDIVAAREQLAAADADIDVTRAAYRPTISVAAQVFQNIGAISNNGGPYSAINRTGYGVFVSFKWPLFEGGLRKTNVSLAVSRKRAAQDALDAARNTATREVVQAYDEIETSVAARTQADAYSRAAEIAYQETLESYRQGLGTVTDLANSEAAVAQADADLEDANAEVQIAQAALALATGQPLPAR
jgi:outer membrane protein